MGFPTIDDTIQAAEGHGLLHLSQRNLVRCPRAVFTSLALTTSLTRLDLSNNLLESLPPTISSLTALTMLWLNENPRLTTLPDALAQCSRLQVVDVSCTALATVPAALATLPRLSVLDITDTPLQIRWLAKNHLTPPPPPINANATTKHEADAQAVTRQQLMCAQILRKLRRKHERVTLKQALFDKLHDELYRVERADTHTRDAIWRTLRRVLKRFPLAEELRSVIRNAERIFPSVPVITSSSASVVKPKPVSELLEAMESEAARAIIDRLRHDHERQKRAADLELKIRNLYFDRIEPSAVAPMVASIYAHVHALSDIQFLLHHARVLFPSEPSHVDGAVIYQRLVALQHEIASERQAAIDKLLAAVKSVYSDTEPARVQELVTAVAALFKNTKDLRSLAADAATLFPTEFLNAKAREVRAAFAAQKAEALGTTTTAAHATMAPTSPSGKIKRKADTKGK